MDSIVPLIASEKLSTLLIKQGITTWQEAAKYIQDLPYGRNKNREDVSLVITERKGTCSSKHALLKTIADENKIANVKLLIGMYKMTQKNTPGIKDHILKSSLSYIPEAHCYLKINEERVDFTAPTSSIKQIEKDIISETEIAPSQVAQWKVDFHKQFIKDWRISENIKMDFDTIWNLREKCISSLSAK
jgi:hypothetical protein